MNFDINEENGYGYRGRLKNAMFMDGVEKFVHEILPQERIESTL